MFVCGLIFVYVYAFGSWPVGFLPVRVCLCVDPRVRVCVWGGGGAVRVSVRVCTSVRVCARPCVCVRVRKQ